MRVLPRLKPSPFVNSKVPPEIRIDPLYAAKLPEKVDVPAPN